MSLLDNVPADPEGEESATQALDGREPLGARERAYTSVVGREVVVRLGAPTSSAGCDGVGHSRSAYHGRDETLAQRVREGLRRRGSVVSDYSGQPYSTWTVPPPCSASQAAPHSWIALNGATGLVYDQPSPPSQSST
jgi:hypothetical protein